MMAQDFSLAGVFKKLAGDVWWPYTDGPLKLHMAKLALMVVEEKAEHINTLGGAPSMPLDDCRGVVFKTYDISRDHYATVAKRVKEAEG